MTMKRMLLGCVLALATFFGLLEAAPPAGSPFISPLVARPASIAGQPFLGRGSGTAYYVGGEKSATREVLQILSGCNGTDSISGPPETPFIIQA